MRIGLYDIDSKYPNLALMKLSAWHKNLGDSVEWYKPYYSYDRIYASKIFTDSKAEFILDGMMVGGSGWDLDIELPEYVEHAYPDYDLYGIDYAMGFLTRGCIRKCGFCIVPRKEGYIRKNADLSEFCRDQEKVMLLDNNILAYGKYLELLEELADSEKRIDFNQGLDIRLINEENAGLLRKIKRWKGIRLRFALDDPELIKTVDRKIKILNDVGISNGIMQFYVLVGYNTTTEEDLKRIKFLEDWGISAFAMPYEKTDYTRKFARWVNRYFYKYESFEKYLGRYKK